MCLFKAPKPRPMTPPPTIKPRLPADSTLPTPKKLTEPDETSDVSYGSKKRKDSTALAMKKGAAALKIPLNKGTAVGMKTGGLNV